jgi:hypothetical protein
MAIVNAIRAEIRDTAFLFDHKAKQKVNGGLVSYRKCVIDRLAVHFGGQYYESKIQQVLGNNGYSRVNKRYRKTL